MADDEAFRRIGRTFKHLQDQINRLATAPLGPVTLGEGDSIRLVSGGQTTFRISTEGASILYQGSLRPMVDILQAEETARVKGDQNISAWSRDYTDSEMTKERTARVGGDNNIMSSLADERKARVGGDNNILGLVATKASKTDLNGYATKVNSQINSLWGAVNRLRSAVSNLQSQINSLGGSGSVDGGAGGGGNFNDLPGGTAPDPYDPYTL